MKIVEIVDFLVKTIVDKPASVKVSFVKKETKQVLQLFVASSDLPRVIGSEGRIFRALRGVVSVMGQQEFGEECDLVVDVVA